MTAPARGRSAAFSVVLLVVGVALRLVQHVPLALSDPTYATPHGNAAGFVRLARLILSGDLLAGREPFFYGPLYSYFLAACWSVSGGEGDLTPRVVQAALGIATAFLVYRLARTCFDESAGRAAGLLMLAYPTGLFFEGLLVASTLEAFLLALCTWLLLRCWPRSASGDPPPPRRDLLLGGAALGLCAWGRGNVLLLAPAMGASLFASAYLRERTRVGLRRVAAGLLPAALVLAGLALCVLPVTLRNALAGGDAVLLVSQGGINLFAGNNPEAREVFVLPQAAGIVTDADAEYEANTREVAERALGRALRPSEVSAYWTRRAVAWWVAQPAAALRLTLRKAWVLLDPYEVPIHQNAQFYRAATPLRYLPLPGWGVLAALALGGIALGVAPWDRAGLLGLWALLYLGTVLPFFVSDRYRFPVVVLLAPFAGRTLAAGLGVARARLRAGAWPGGARRVGVAVLVAGVAAVALRARLVLPSASLVTPDMRGRYLALEHYRHGAAEEARGAEDAAFAHYERALAASPGHVQSRLAHARLLAARGQQAEAAAELRTLLSLQPDNAEALRLLEAINPAPAHPP